MEAAPRRVSPGKCGTSHRQGGGRLGGGKRFLDGDMVRHDRRTGRNQRVVVTQQAPSPTLQVPYLIHMKPSIPQLGPQLFFSSQASLASSQPTRMMAWLMEL